ncbi:MAG: type 4a pilus biogenesis protein PilO [bacterium]|jgi:Tfp pilus assembly protein PilO
MGINTKKARVSQLVFFTFFFGFVFCSYYYLYLPLLNKLESLDLALQESRMILAEQQAQLEQSKLKQAEAEKLAHELQEAMQTFSKAKRVSTFLLELEKAAITSGVRLASLQPLSREKEEVFFIDIFQVEILGDYGQIIDFIGAMNQLQGINNVIGLDLVRNPEEELIKVNLQLKTIYLMPEREVISIV